MPSMVSQLFSAQYDKDNCKQGETKELFCSEKLEWIETLETRRHEEWGGF